MSTGYGERRQVQFDIEHITDLIEFGVELLGTGGHESKIVYPDASIQKLATPAIAGGESYLFTTQPLNAAGIWEFTCAYRLAGDSKIAISSQCVQVRVNQPDNSLLQDDVDGVTS
jgi:hypothetical protein